jgi:hypothetical protein
MAGKNEERRVAMGAIILLDTSILTNLLDIPEWNQNRASVDSEFRQCIQNDDTFYLPIATILETGKHIVRLSDGQERRKFAKKFVSTANDAINGARPFTVTDFPQRQQLLEWLRDFPDCALTGKSLSDVSIVKEWETACARFNMSRVRIWSLDRHLAGFDRFQTA